MIDGAAPALGLGARARVVAQERDGLAPADVEHRPERQDGGEADVLPAAPVQDRGEERPALAHEADAAVRREVPREGGVELSPRSNEAEPVRAEEAGLAVAERGP